MSMPIRPGKPGSAYASWAQIQKARQNPVSDKSDQYTQPHKHTRAPQGGRRNPIRRLGNGHHHRLLRSCHRHPNRTFDQFHTSWKSCLRDGKPYRRPGRSSDCCSHIGKRYIRLPTDNGCEFAAHQEITKQLSLKGRPPVKVYFTDAYSAWQKGAIENANKLIRKYIPKKANFQDFSDWKIKEIQKKLNRRPSGKT